MRENEANYVEYNAEEEMLLMASTGKYDKKKGDVWFLDSGCNNHMSGDKNLFYDME